MSVVTQPLRKNRISRKDDLKKIEDEMRQRIAVGAWAPGKMVPSRRDLAIEFGVDLNTVQRAMTPLLSDGTLRAENGRGTFVPFSEASALQNAQNGASAAGRTVTIGIAAYFNNDLAARGEELPATHTILKAIESQASDSGARAVFMNRWRRNEVELSPAHCVRELLAQGADCVAVVDVYSHPYVLSELRSMPDLKDLPVVYISAINHYVPCAHVYFDNRDAGYKAADLLIHAGYRQITFLSPYIGRWVDLRAEGARIACANRQEPIDFRIVPEDRRISIFEDDAPQRARESVCRFASSNGIHGGIIAAHDVVAVQVFEEGHKLGRNAGAHYGLVGFDDEPIAFSHGLSTMRPPLEAIGAEAMKLALSCMQDDRWNREISLPTQTIVRNTHTRLNEKGDC